MLLLQHSNDAHLSIAYLEIVLRCYLEQALYFLYVTFAIGFDARPFSSNFTGTDSAAILTASPNCVAYVVVVALAI